MPGPLRATGSKQKMIDITVTESGTHNKIWKGTDRIHYI